MSRSLKAIIEAKEYSYLEALNYLKGIDEYKIAYESRNSKKRAYSLEDHTKMVCNMFEKWFAHLYTYTSFEISSFRLMLCVHDIGKPSSLINNDKYNQYLYTIRLIDMHRNIYPLPDGEYKTLISIISDDPIGLYIRDKIDISTAVKKISKMLTISSSNFQEFWHLLIMYYQVDAGAYTSLGYIGSPTGFIEKPKLEKVFKRNQNGNFVYHKNGHRLLFSDDIEIKIEDLHTKFINTVDY